MNKRAQEHLDIITAVTDAMFHLMNEKDIEQITILELINKAGIARGTFYNNFGSKDEVIEKYVDEVIATFGDSVKSSCLDDYFSNDHIIDMLHFASKYEKQLLGLKRNDLGELYLEHLTQYLLSKPFNDSLNAKLRIFGLAGLEYNLIFNWYLEDTEGHRELIEALVKEKNALKGQF